MMKPGREMIVKIALFILVAVLFVLFLGQCEKKRREEAAQARLEKEVGAAKDASGADAINTVTERGAAEAASQDLTRNNERDIRAAPDAGTRITGTDAAGRVALCKREAYKNHPKCRGLQR